MDFGRSGRKRSGKVCGTGGPLLEAGPGSRWGSCWDPAGWGHLRTSPGTRKTALRLPIPEQLADQDVPALRSPLRLPAVSESHGRRSRGARSSWSQGHCCPPDHPLWLSLDALGPRPFPWTLALLGPPFPVGCYPGQNDPLPPPHRGRPALRGGTGPGAGARSRAAAQDTSENRNWGPNTAAALDPTGAVAYYTSRSGPPAICTTKGTGSLLPACAWSLAGPRAQAGSSPQPEPSSCQV